MKINSLFLLIFVSYSFLLNSKISIDNKVPGDIELRFKQCGCSKSYYLQSDTNKSPKVLELGINEIELFKDNECNFTAGKKFFARGMAKSGEQSSVSNSVEAQDGKNYTLNIENNSFVLKKNN